MIMLIVIINSY